MLKYSELTKAQKRFVDAVLREFPAIKKSGTVSRKELESIYWTLNEKRETGGEKVGFPNWLTGPNKVARGVFQVPMPEGAVAKVKKAAVAEKEKFEAIVNDSAILDADFDEEYDVELEEARNAAYEIANS
jgi:hypothetical protein